MYAYLALARETGLEGSMRLRATGLRLSLLTVAYPCFAVRVLFFLAVAAGSALSVSTNNKAPSNWTDPRSVDTKKKPCRRNTRNYADWRRFSSGVSFVLS